jgi:hypothetical protein
LAPASNASFLKAGWNEFSDGVDAGKEEAEGLWRQQGSDCANVWTFQSTVDDTVSWMYPDSGNWKTRSYNRGARAGASQVVEKYEKKCLENSPDECNDVGLAAAAEIAFEFCPFSVDYAADQGVYDYKKTCRSVAYGICKGAVGGSVQANGCSLTTSQTLRLQNKCKAQVDSMTTESNTMTMTDDNDITIIVDDDDVDNVIITIDDAFTSSCARKSSCDSCIGSGCSWVEGDGLGSGKCFDNCDQPNYSSKALWVCWDGTQNTPDMVCSRDTAEILSE